MKILRAGAVLALFACTCFMPMVSYADTASDWWAANCNASAGSKEGRVSPMLLVDLGDNVTKARVGASFTVFVQGAMTKHADLSASDAQVKFGPKMCLDAATVYGVDGCPSQGEAGKYNFLHTVTIEGTPRNVVLKATDGGVLFPGEMGGSRPICKEVGVEGVAKAVTTTTTPDSFGGSVFDAVTGVPVSGVRAIVSKIDGSKKLITCGTATTDASGRYTITARVAETCFKEATLVTASKEGYFSERVSITPQMGGILPSLVIRKMCRASVSPTTPYTPGGGTGGKTTGVLSINGSTNAVEVLQGGAVTFTLANAVQGQIEGCYQVLNHPNFPNTPGNEWAHTPESTSCTTFSPFGGNDDWKFNTQNNTLVGIFSADDPSWNIPGLKVRSTFRKTGTSDTVTATMIIDRPDPNSGSYRWKGPVADFSPLPPSCAKTPTAGTPCSKLNFSCTVSGTNNVYVCENPSTAKSQSFLTGVVPTVVGAVSNVWSGVSDTLDTVLGVSTKIYEWVKGVIGRVAMRSDSNVAQVGAATWDGFGNRVLSGTGRLGFMFDPDAIGRPETEAVMIGWGKLEGGPSAGIRAYAWLTDEDGVLVGGDPGISHSIIVDHVISQKLIPGRTYYFNYIFPPGWNFNVIGNPRAPEGIPWHGVETRLISGTGNLQFAWYPELLCSSGATSLSLQWNLPGSIASDYGAAIWITDPSGEVVGGSETIPQKGTLSVSGLVTGGQYMLHYSFPPSVTLAIRGSLQNAGAVVTSGNNCTTQATYTKEFTANGQKIVYALAPGQTAATAFVPQAGSVISLSTTETLLTTDAADHQVSVSKCPGDFSATGQCTYHVQYTGSTMTAFGGSVPVNSTYCALEPGAKYYMNVRQVKHDNPGTPSCLLGSCEVRVQVQNLY